MTEAEQELAAAVASGRADSAEPLVESIRAKAWGLGLHMSEEWIEIHHSVHRAHAHIARGDGSKLLVEGRRICDMEVRIHGSDDAHRVQIVRRDNRGTVVLPVLARQPEYDSSPPGWDSEAVRVGIEAALGSPVISSSQGYPGVLFDPYTHKPYLSVGASLSGADERAPATAGGKGSHVEWCPGSTGMKVYDDGMLGPHEGADLAGARERFLALAPTERHVWTAIGLVKAIRIHTAEWENWPPAEWGFDGGAE